MKGKSKFVLLHLIVLLAGFGTGLFAEPADLLPASKAEMQFLTWLLPCFFIVACLLCAMVEKFALVITTKFRRRAASVAFSAGLFWIIARLCGWFSIGAGLGLIVSVCWKNQIVFWSGLVFISSGVGLAIGSFIPNWLLRYK